jgi:hypothetical protein
LLVAQEVAVVVVVQRVADLVVVLVRVKGLHQETLAVGILPLVVVIGNLLMQIQTDGVMAGEEDVVGGGVDLVVAGLQPPLKDLRAKMALLPR